MKQSQTLNFLVSFSVGFDGEDPISIEEDIPSPSMVSIFLHLQSVSAMHGSSCVVVCPSCFGGTG